MGNRSQGDEWRVEMAAVSRNRCAPGGEEMAVDAREHFFVLLSGRSLSAAWRTLALVAAICDTGNTDTPQSARPCIQCPRSALSLVDRQARIGTSETLTD